MKLRLSILFALLALFAVAANAQVVINEIYYDSPSTDIHVFTELKGTPGTDLTGYMLVGVNGNPTNPGPYDSVALVGTIPASGYFVVAQDTGVANYNQIAGIHCDWQNAGSATSTPGDNLLLKLNGNIVDAVGYGNFSGADSAADWMGEPTNNRAHSAPDCNPGLSISRLPDGQDTNDNQADFQATSPTPGVANTGSLPTPTAITLQALRQMNNSNGVPTDTGAYIITHGVCNVLSSVFGSTSNRSYSIQDRQLAGVWIYGPSSVAANAGDSITVQGNVLFYNGQTEIGGSNLLVTNNGTPHVALPEPYDVSTGQLASSDGEPFEGVLIRVTNATIGTGNWPVQDSSGNVSINDGSGAVTMNIFKGTDLDGWAGHPVAGDVVPFIVGIGNQYCRNAPYNTYYELQPRGQMDIVTTGVNDHHLAPVIDKFEIKSTYPNPFNHTTKIHYTITNGERASLAVYDINGRLVATLGKDIAAGNRLAMWNGRNNAGQSVAGGMYFIRLVGQSHVSTMKAIYLP